MKLEFETPITAITSANLVNLFGKQYAYLFRPPPAAKRGGTFFYCRHPVEVQVPKYDKIGRRTGRFETALAPCDRRFRRPKTYRRHWRKAHQEA